ncbi:hypothetical protein SAMN05192561_101863 [Halopenitus malekzadehii]|uniref:Uncharacterized protein n=1 Tax=Halopenitus malekzadehii TaxID=1267564 RepID=A0A1H6I7A8_9EURY|nr:hypothetical protein SAMN05192561_101863 [Halopenitus malekzadehii]
MFIVMIVLSRNEYRAVTARIINVESLRDGSFASSFVSLKHLSHRRCGTQDNNNTSVIIIRKRPDRRRYDRQVPNSYPSPSSATTAVFLSRRLTVTVWTSLLVCLSVTNEPPHGFCDDRGAVDGGTDRRCRISGAGMVGSSTGQTLPVDVFHHPCPMPIPAFRSDQSCVFRRLVSHRLTWRDILGCRSRHRV